MTHLLDFHLVMPKLVKSAEIGSLRTDYVYGAEKFPLSKSLAKGVMPVNAKTAYEKSKFWTLRSPLTGEVISSPIKRGRQRKPSPGLTKELAKIWVAYSNRVDQAKTARRPSTRLLMGISMDEHRIFNTKIHIEVYKTAGYSNSRYQP